MSSIYITSRLHSSWKRSTKYWAAEMRRVCGEEGGFTRMAPRPSQSEPPPEEFGAILQSVLPYVQRGVTATTISAIISGATSTLGGVPTTSLLPLAYYGGLSAASLGFEGMCLSFPRDYVGCPFVPVEEFPLSRYFPVGELPNTLIPFPPYTHGSIVIAAPRGFNFLPIQFSSPSAVLELDTPNVHARELERTGAPGFFLRNIFSQIRYTGCMRIATDAEVDALFESAILPDRWLKNAEINLRDFFSQIGVEPRVVAEACELTDAALRPAETAATAPLITDVPARRRRGSARDIVAAAMAPPQPPVATDISYSLPPSVTANSMPATIRNNPRRAWASIAPESPRHSADQVEVRPVLQQEAAYPANHLIPDDLI